MNHFMRHGLAALAVAAAAAPAWSAAVYPDFTVNESSVVGVPANQTFVADKLNGGYSEVLTINSDLSFSTNAFAQFTAYFKNDGATAVTGKYLNSVAPAGYNLYAVFSSTGFVTANGFTGTNGSFKLYLDLDQNTDGTGGANGATPFTLTGNADDVLLATGTTLKSGQGSNGPPPAFDLLFSDFSLSTAGKNYFVAPNPFYMIVDVNGDFDNAALTPGTQSLVGDLSAVFQNAVPEPNALALVGAALVGLGIFRRKGQA